MRKYFILAVAAAALGALGCKKKAPEQIPQPKAETQTAAVSTAPAVEQNPLKMPGNYLKTQVGNIDKAKAAKALYEKAAADHMETLDLGGSGGN